MDYWSRAESGAALGPAEQHPGRGLFAGACPADSLQALLSERYTRTPIVYLSVLLVVGGICISLPLVPIPVSVRAAGMIRPTVERQEIRAGQSGVVVESWMREGQTVSAGDQLLRFDGEALDARRAQVARLRRETQTTIRDLELLGRSAVELGVVPRWPGAGALAAELVSYRAGLAEQSSRAARVGDELSRAEQLWGRGLLAAAEVERLRHDAAAERAGLERYVAESRARWSEAAAEQKALLSELDAESAALAVDQQLLTVTAPISGSIEDVARISKGSFVSAGERLATLSPASRLRVEAHLGAREVALVRPGARVHVRVHGFAPGEWGLLSGRVVRVGGDYVLMNGRPTFRLEVELERDHLRLPNGRIGALRKGLPVEVRIVVARPSALRFLKDTITDWIDPLPPHP